MRLTLEEGTKKKEKPKNWDEWDLYDAVSITLYVIIITLERRRIESYFISGSGPV